MLKSAYLYQEEIQIEYEKIKFDEKYKYYFVHSYRNEKFKLMQGNKDWDGIEFVSVKDGEVIGYLMATIDKDWNVATGLRIINFKNKGNITFASDLYKFLESLFVKYEVRKLQFQCICGNPIEGMYIKYCERYGGNIVGTFHDAILLDDGKVYDYKLFEVFKKDFDRISSYKKERKIRL